MLRASGFGECGRPTEMIFDASAGLAGMYAPREEWEPVEGSQGQMQTWDDGRLQFSLMIAAMADNAVNLWMTARARAVGRLFLRDEGDRFFETISLLADAVNAGGGYGGFDLLYQPLALEDVASAILRNPQHHDGPPPDFAIASRQLDTRQAWQAKAGEERVVSDLSETYLLLVEKDFDGYILCFY